MILKTTKLLIKIILCAYNEAQNLKKLLANLNYELKILDRDFEIICCLDGTSDNSLDVIDDFNNSCKITTLPLINQRGLGLTFKRLFLEVIKNSNDDDLVISLDADNTHNPEQIPAMINHFEKQNLDVLVASRFCNDSTMDNFPKHRQLISKSISLLLQTLFPIKKINHQKLKDYTSGFRIYRALKLKELHQLKKDDFIREPEFTYTCELLINLSRINCKIDEVAVLYDYGQKMGASKLRLWRNMMRLMILIKNLFSSGGWRNKFLRFWR